MTDQSKKPLVGVIMGSNSDWDVMQHAVAILKQFGVPHEAQVISAHRMPDEMFAYAESARSRGLRAIIAGAGGAAHLPGMVASLTPLPVIGVPVTSRALSGLDSLYSIVQMPAGIPVATVAIGNATNAGLLAVQILAVADPALRDAVVAHRASLAASVEARDRRLQELGSSRYLAERDQPAP